MGSKSDIEVNLHSIAEAIGSSEILNVNSKYIAPISLDVILNRNSYLSVQVCFYFNNRVSLLNAFIYPDR
jgi:hypothetical protein